ncbi:hypothetical protein Hanom_Chr17g01591351 [Helianthus anomalus]
MPRQLKLSLFWSKFNNSTNIIYNLHVKGIQTSKIKSNQYLVIRVELGSRYYNKI